MRVLVADDDRLTRDILERLLTQWGFEPTMADCGEAAWKILTGGAPPRLLLLDWMMPTTSGLEICQRLRKVANPEPPYVIMLTSRTKPEDIAEGLNAGADDYVGKPFHHSELRARLRAGARMLRLRGSMERLLRDMRTALSATRAMHGTWDICMYCHRIRDDEQHWQELDTYVRERSGIRISHGLCPDCRKDHHPPASSQMSVTAPPDVPPGDSGIAT